MGGLHWQGLSAAALALTCTCMVHDWLQRDGCGWQAASCLSLQEQSSAGEMGLLLVQSQARRGARSSCTTRTFDTSITNMHIIFAEEGVLGFSAAPCWITFHKGPMRAQKVVRLHCRSPISIFMHLLRARVGLCCLTELLLLLWDQIITVPCHPQQTSTSVTTRDSGLVISISVLLLSSTGHCKQDERQLAAFPQP